MTITDERTRKQTFGNLPYGTVFEYDLIAYMKTHETDEINAVNAVSVYEGIFEYFDSGTYVQPLDAELIIRG